MDLPSGLRAGMRESGEEKPAVVVVMENRFMPVATSHHACPGVAFSEDGLGRAKP
jgi:hypothetical protein